MDVKFEMEGHSERILLLLNVGVVLGDSAKLSGGDGNWAFGLTWDDRRSGR